MVGECKKQRQRGTLFRREWLPGPSRGAGRDPALTRYPRRGAERVLQLSRPGRPEATRTGGCSATRTCLSPEGWCRRSVATPVRVDRDQLRVLRGVLSGFDGALDSNPARRVGRTLYAPPAASPSRLRRSRGGAAFRLVGPSRSDRSDGRLEPAGPSRYSTDAERSLRAPRPRCADCLRRDRIARLPRRFDCPANAITGTPGSAALPPAFRAENAPHKSSLGGHSQANLDALT